MPQLPNIFVYSRILNPVENLRWVYALHASHKTLFEHLIPVYILLVKLSIFHSESESRGEEKYIPAISILCPNNLQDGHKMDKTMTTLKTITKILN